MAKPLIHIGLQRFCRLIEVFPKGDTEELVQNGSVETFDEPVRSGRSDLGSAVFDSVERQVQFKGMRRRTAKLRAVICQNRSDFKTMIRIEGKRVVMQQRRGALRPLPRVEESKGIGAIGIRDSLQINLPDPLQSPHGRTCPRTAALRASRIPHAAP